MDDWPAGGKSGEVFGTDLRWRVPINLQESAERVQGFLDVLRLSLGDDVLLSIAESEHKLLLSDLDALVAAATIRHRRNDG